MSVRGDDLADDWQPPAAVGVRVPIGFVNVAVGGTATASGSLVRSYTNNWRRPVRRLDGSAPCCGSKGNRT